MLFRMKFWGIKIKAPVFFFSGCISLSRLLVRVMGKSESIL